MGVKLIVTGYILGALFVTLGGFLVGFNKQIVHFLVKSQTRLVPGTITYDLWLHLPVEIYMSFYLFNVRNPSDFETRGAKPDLEEIGPFTYKEQRIKENVVNHANETITYKEKRVFTFVRELSCCDDTFNVTTLNMAVIPIINLLKSKPKIFHWLVQEGLRLTGEKLFVTQPAGRLLFGYDDALMKLLHSLEQVPSPTIGLFMNKNDTYDGEYTILTGEDNVNEIGIIQTFNGMEVLSYWSTKYANAINGTDSTVNYPFMDKSSKPYTFQPDICRSVYEVYNRTDTFTSQQIEAYGYILDESTFLNVSLNPDNAGFCTPAENCLITGIINVTTCNKIGQIEVPSYFSMPHYMFGDRALVDAVLGLSPNFTKHRTEIFFEPLTGMPVKANKRVQLSARTMRDESIDFVKNIPEIYFPLMWIDEHTEITEKLADVYNKRVRLPLRIFDGTQYSMIGMGALILVLSMASHLIRRRRSFDVNDPSSPNEITPLINN